MGTFHQSEGGHVMFQKRQFLRSTEGTSDM